MPRELQSERRYWARHAEQVVRFEVDGTPVDLTVMAAVDLNGDPVVAVKHDDGDAARFLRPGPG